MAIAFDAATDGGNTGGGTSLTFAHTCSGSGRVLLVGCQVGTGFSAIDTITSVTYDSVAMTRVLDMTNASFVHHNYLYILVGPNSGTHNVVISVSGGSQEILAGAVSYTGCGTTQPDATDTTAGGTGGATSTLTTTVDNCWLVLWENCYPGTAAGTAPATERVHDAAYVNWYFFDSNGPSTPAGSVSLTTTRTGAGYGTCHLMVALAPAGAAAGETSVARATFF